VSLFPPWWPRTRSSLRSILNKILSFESEEDSVIDSEIPLGQYRSAGLLASLQIESIHFLLHLSSAQLNQFSSHQETEAATGLLSSASLIVSTRSNSTTSFLTQSEDTPSSSLLQQLILSEKNSNTKIYSFPLLLTTLRCLTRLLEHRDKHIHSVAFKILPKIIRLRTQIRKQINSFPSSCPSSEVTDWIHFDQFLSQSLEETILPSLLDLLQLKERSVAMVADPSSVRILVDSLISLGSQEIQTKIQVTLSLLLTTHPPSPLCSDNPVGIIEI
jgi:hypothetical protein